MKRREQALRKIRRLESQLDTASDPKGDKIVKEICRLQSIHSITLEEIRGPKDYTKMFPFLPEPVLKILGGKGK